MYFDSSKEKLEKRKMSGETVERFEPWDSDYLLIMNLAFTHTFNDFINVFYYLKIRRIKVTYLFILNEIF